MPLPTDPMLAQQWHLRNNTPGLLDLNVFGVWDPTEGPAYTGAGTRTVVIDDGFDYTHPDFDNYDQTRDFDFDGVDLDPFGTAADRHGTAVAGIIGAAADGTGVVGVAYGTSLVGYRTHGFINDFWLQNIRSAIYSAAMWAQGDVANISQGISNNPNSEFGNGYNAARFAEIEASIATAVNSGRGGLGMTIVKSAGNARGGNYDVNSDDWTNDTRQVVVAAVDQNGSVSYYSSYGAAILVSGFGTPGEVVTTDRVGAAGYNGTDFTSSFNGTSAAAPMVSGVVALMYDAEAGLGWRDVQTILGASARHVGSAVGAGTAGSERFAWGFNGAKTWNGGGQHFSNDYGYGLVDALAAVRMAESWLLTGTSAARTANQFTNTMDVLNAATVIPDGNLAGTSFAGTAIFNHVVERVRVTMTFSTTRLADLEVYLTSPTGTVSQLIADQAGSAEFNGTWTFETQAFRGERAAGTWTVRVVDDQLGATLTVSDIVIRTYGSNSTDDRYIYTDEYSVYAGLFGHSTTVTDTNGGTDTVNASAVTTGSNIRLDGVAGTIDGTAATFNNIENAIGGDGNDTIIGNGVANMLFGMRGADQLFGGGGNDTLEGFSGNDYLDGGSGIDVLRGGDGNDTLSQNFGTGIETLDGGNGSDTADWSYSGADWVIDLATGIARIGAQQFATLISIENAVGGSGNDSIRGGIGPTRLEGGNGNDTLDGFTGTDSLYGGEGDDVLIQKFGGANEVMDGGDGNDTGDWSFSTLNPWTFDLVAGQARIGDTPYALLFSIENVVGGQLADTMIGDANANVLDGQAGNDSIAAGNGNDTLLGGAGDDTLNGGTGTDSMIGGTGNDWYFVDSASDIVVELAGEGTADRVLASVSYALSAAADIELLTTTLQAGTDAINLTGNNLAQQITGNAGNNVLDGKGGNDTLNGLGGNDTFVFSTALGPTNVDRILNYSVAEDVIHLDDAVFTGLALGALAASAFVANATGTATSALHRIIYQTTTGKLFFDVDGVGGAAAIQFAQLDAGLDGFNHGEFVVI